jgi:hypothetical protein
MIEDIISNSGFTVRESCIEEFMEELFNFSEYANSN